MRMIKNTKGAANTLRMIFAFMVVLVLVIWLGWIETSESFI